MKKVTIAALIALASCAKMTTKPTNKTTAEVNEGLKNKTGNVLFWTPVSGKNLVVYVNGYSRITSTSDVVEPACGADLHINERLNVGEYTYRAVLISYYNNGTSDSVVVNGKVDVVEGGCMKVKVQ